MSFPSCAGVELRSVKDCGSVSLMQGMLLGYLNDWATMDVGVVESG